MSAHRCKADLAESTIGAGWAVPLARIMSGYGMAACGVERPFHNQVVSATDKERAETLSGTEGPIAWQLDQVGAVRTITNIGSLPSIERLDGRKAVERALERPASSLSRRMVAGRERRRDSCATVRPMERFSISFVTQTNPQKRSSPCAKTSARYNRLRQQQCTGRPFGFRRVATR